MVMEAILSPSMVRVTTTSPPKPLAVPISASRAEAGAVRAWLRASTTAVEVMVAPESASTFSPRANGPDLPTNCFWKSSSSITRWPKPGVSQLASIWMAVTTPASSKVAFTVTSPPKPLAEPVCTSPVRAG